MCFDVWYRPAGLFGSATSSPRPVSTDWLASVFEVDSRQQSISLRSFLKDHGGDEELCLLKIDLRNAFNQCNRHAFLRRTRLDTPELFGWVQTGSGVTTHQGATLRPRCSQSNLLLGCPAGRPTGTTFVFSWLPGAFGWECLS